MEASKWRYKASCARVRTSIGHTLGQDAAYSPGSNGWLVVGARGLSSSSAKPTAGGHEHGKVGMLVAVVVMGSREHERRGL